MTIPDRRLPEYRVSQWWETVRYAIDSTARTLRLCAIMLTAVFPTILMTLLIHHI